MACVMCWFGRERRRVSEYVGRRMLRSEASGRRSRPEGEKKRRFIKAVKEGMKLVGGEKRVQIDSGR